MRKKISETLSLLSGISLLAVIYIYWRGVAYGSTTPNPSTWFVWFVLSWMNVTSYWDVAATWQKRALTVCGTTGITLMFAYTAIMGKFGSLGSVEIAISLGCLAVGYFWKTTRDAEHSNWLLQAIYVLSFVPMYCGLIVGTAREVPLAFDLSLIAYGMAIVGIVILPDYKNNGRSKTQQMFSKLAHPVLNGIVGNGGVSLLIRLMG